MDNHFPGADVAFVVAAWKLRDPKLTLGIHNTGLWSCSSQGRSGSYEHVKPFDLLAVVGNFFFKFSAGVFQFAEGSPGWRGHFFIVVEKGTFCSLLESQCTHSVTVVHAEKVVG